MAKNEKAVASVLAFEKKLVPSDGYFYGTTWEKRTEQSALNLIEKSVRGTVSHRLKKTTDQDMLKLNMDIANPNPQKVDACALAEHQDTLKVAFTLKVLGGIEQPSACNNETFLNSYKEVAKNYIQTHGFTELAKRYALNIANARFLWRNRVGAEKIEVVVTVNDQDSVTFNAFDYKLHDFDSVDAKVQNLADQIANALKGELPYLLIKVEAYALVGKAQEVYPSEELVLDKGKGDKSKILYQVNGVAAMHSQKIGNALRTIDTWYPEFEEQKSAIAIEPYGAVTNLGKAYRTPKAKQDFFSLFDKYALGESLENVEQEHYVMAVLVRGGVFGQSSKD
ncbi:type I-F CRISPR-associated protein Csy3 [Acinetobacter junii]|jgi:CRISPR-associated protein Csy3|uniref:CRISPR-associated protein, Csy3 family n=1 Tax=Acinetobacter junii CIP 107470 = MTCC 11364 TaxID=1217666 RepID=S7WDM8_ACIJU|nr:MULTISPECIES: type I-F CRISPR-associated protein Csy3 [Acinetobacter]ENV52233.1 CRISPR type I-f/ypest-associated protein csy3 [Acinetobacter junii CIP 107470 = MTCC 11364]EPR81195.1 CRISPR-associated protein, Csy3 family [Acinetobacter junii CIP 107470 = MTCC 11364]NAR77718.1 type I-F CRISPR-associated protein Csy3 [Acinetobacter haemolyticus]RSN74998.1 type I-F CRISPR-associated protein Csy3 [Acinetobacter haemolyticus]RTE44999.1 type I-F CRISPR-associated protein Csy3 [Acinetobacter junii